MWQRIMAAWSLLQKGKAVADPVTWKSRTLATNTVLGVLGALVALAKAYGYDVVLDDATLSSLAAGIVAAVSVGNVVVHVVTDHRLGVSSGSNGGAAGGPSDPTAPAT